MKDAVPGRGERWQWPQLLPEMVVESDVEGDLSSEASQGGWEHVFSLLGCSRVEARSAFTGWSPASRLSMAGTAQHTSPRLQACGGVD